MPLRDVLTSRPKLLFVGINPGIRSEAVGHQFAGPGNPFWRLLRVANLIPEPLTYAEDRRLADFGMAITNLCPRATRSASELKRAEFEAGGRVLERKIRRIRPKLVAFVGVTLYRRFFGGAGRGNPGPGMKPEEISRGRVFVPPEPRGVYGTLPRLVFKLRRIRRVVRG